ncbi:unnamed protein product [Bursaphelenchus xylophilus]|uniref:(pine wood nematode) hypothetical protein n=1 Tax=Bursaphelenchus xylophilus TaxID=6326 RepID=A0A1I7SPP7_BURXY|nr:unnamed protein product [Bursaphelenchus xylophilus]CAG9131664.1 unnamed protein product [Bursaphelenchus xylophilus]
MERKSKRIHKKIEKVAETGCVPKVQNAVRPVSFCEEKQVAVDFSAKDLPHQPMTISIISANPNKAGMIFFRSGLGRPEAGSPMERRYLIDQKPEFLKRFDFYANFAL